jgi:hypothetical protein
VKQAMGGNAAGHHPVAAGTLFFSLEDRQWWQVLTQNNSDKRCMRHHR